MVDVLGHEAAAAALETEHVAAGEVLHHLVLAAVLEHLVLELRNERRLAPAQPAQVMLPGGS